MDNLGYNAPPLGLYFSPPAPSTPTPGHPVPNLPNVAVHSGGVGCGCGGCGASSPVAASPALGTAVATLEPPRFMQASALAFDTPAGFVPPPLTGELDMFANWQTDWWKYIVGAVLGRIILGK